jgi:predicted signal transduction protein with EAL and GGDEF domain
VTVARLGGDEFAVLVEGVTDDGQVVAGQLTDSLLEPLVVDQDRLHLSGSIGIALAPEHATTVGDLLKRADIAMYVAKNGPDAVAVYRPEIDGHDPAVLSLMGELRDAITTGEVAVGVEPVLDLLTGQLASAEALLRWYHPTRGTLLPSAFLAAAERNGLIIPLTERVLDLAVGACARWQEAGLHIGISVNISARSLMDQRLPATVAAALERHRLPAHLLTLEITESIVIGDAGRAVALLDELRGLGVRLSLDDFGTGYSSLSYLKRFPVDAVKVDRAFVDGLGTDPHDTALVAAIVAMAEALGLEVTAEGVETQHQLANLKRLNCQRAQGYFLAPPMPAEAMDELVAGSHRWQID